MPHHASDTDKGLRLQFLIGWIVGTPSMLLELSLIGGSSGPMLSRDVPSIRAAFAVAQCCGRSSFARVAAIRRLDSWQRLGRRQIRLSVSADSLSIPLLIETSRGAAS